MQITEEGNRASNLLNVSVILCAYTLDRWDDLKRAVRSVEAQTIQPFELILVIDHNPDLFLLAQKHFTDAEVIENREAKGLSGARNTGIARASGEIIAFMDEDAVADPDWIEHLLQGYEDRQVQGVGGKIEPNWLSSKPAWFPEEFNWVVGCTYKGLATTVSPVRNLIGCNMSFRQEIFTSVGGFRNGIGRIGTLPVGCEETEFCIRARQCNPSVRYLYQPEAVVAHNVPEWRVKKSYFLQRCYAEGISKAMVTGLVGSGQGLASERSYTTRTLPKGIVSGLSDAFLHGELDGLGRAAAIIAGLGMTTLGYSVGVLFQRRTFLLTTRNGSPNKISSSSLKKERQSPL